LLVRVLDSVAVVVDDLEEVVAVVTEATVTSENSTTMVVVVAASVAADSAEHQLKAGIVEVVEEDSAAHLPQLHMVELHPMVVVVEDMAVEDTETHPVAVDNPGGNPSTSPLSCSFVVSACLQVCQTRNTVVLQVLKGLHLFVNSSLSIL
jgi:hypothetical protein